MARYRDVQRARVELCKRMGGVIGRCGATVSFSPPAMSSSTIKKRPVEHKLHLFIQRASSSFSSTLQ